MNPSGTKVVRKWYESHTKVVRKWYESGTKSATKKRKLLSV
jgi:hypothetical protein